MRKQGPSLSSRIGVPLRKITTRAGAVLLVPAALLAWDGFRNPHHHWMFIPAAVLGFFGFAIIRLGRRMSRSIEAAFTGYGIDKAFSVLKGFGTVMGGKPSVGGGTAEGVAGMPGIGRVTAIRHTPLRVNDDPIVDVDLDVKSGARRSFRAGIRAHVPAEMLPFLRVGADLPVIIGDTTPPEVSINWGRVEDPGVDTPRALPAEPNAEARGTVGGFATFAALHRLSDPAREGVQGEFATGNEYRVSMTIRADDRRPPYTITTTVTVPTEKQSKIALGSRVPVRISRTNSESISIEWDKL
ncbi:MAG: hypothetical protein NVSMB57_00380 [Actinomycetota bacterium]